MTATVTQADVLDVAPQRTRSLQSVCLTFPVGQRDEPPGLEGLAHLVEHLFHCRDEVGASAFFRSMQLRGVNANAYTGADYLQFWAALPPESVSDWACGVGERLLHPRWQADTVARELEVIRHEVESKVEKHPHRGFSFHHTRPALFADHANAHAGFLDNPHLRDLSTGELVEHYRDLLDPATAVLSTVGPMTDGEADAALRPLLDHLPEGPRAPRAPRRFQLAGPGPRVIVPLAGSPAACALTFPIVCPPEGSWSRTLAANQLLATLLAQRGDQSAVVTRAGMTATARVGINTDAAEDRSPSCLTVSVVGPRGSDLSWFPDAVRTALADPMSVCDPYRLSAARSYLLVGLARKVENGVARARVSAWLRLFAGTTPEGYARVVSTITGDEVDAAARRLLAHAGTEVSL